MRSAHSIALAAASSVPTPRPPAPQPAMYRPRMGVKTGGRLIKHARYFWLLLAQSHLTRRLFAGMLRKIAALPLPAG